MFAHDVHVSLAIATVAIFAVTAVEAAFRTVTARPPGRTSEALSAITLIAVGVTAAGGLALLLHGKRPAESIHLVYAVVAFVLVPFADSLATHAAPRRRAAARLIGALLALAVLVRLFATG